MRDVDEFLAAEERALATLTRLHVAAVAACAAAEPDHASELRELSKLTTHLRDLMDDRYGLQVGMGVDHGGSFEDWVLEVDDLIDELANQKFPFFQGAQKRQRDDHAARARDAIAEANVLLGEFRHRAFDMVCAQGPAAAGEFLSRVEDEIVAVASSVAALPRGAGAIGRDGTEVAPVARLVYEVGSVRASRIDVTVVPGGMGSAPAEARTVAVPGPPVDVPLLLAPDRSGGLVTDAPATVNALVLHALAMLPAGRVTCGVFDPQRLGESMSFVYALGDAAERVIGAKVRTTPAELAELLLSLEQHITFVTQKYLQGQHESLTDYNVSAGEVSEPYRLLVLYDFPHGFSRSAQYADEETLARLGKIVSAGPRCGVFTLVVDPNDIVHSYPDSFYAAPLRGLPRLRASAPVSASTLATLLRRSDGGPDVTAPELAPVLDLPNLRRPYADDESFRAGCGYAEKATRLWTFTSAPMPDTETQQRVMNDVARGLALAEDIRVSPDQVAALYDGRLRRHAARDRLPMRLAAAFDDDATWWAGHSVDGVAVAFGRVGASDVSVLQLDSKVFSGVLVGGRPGAGKSVLLHSIVTGLALQFAPDELELYLVDFKEGVEFKQYADLALPHARVVAIESERDFGLSVLHGLDREITRRGALFRGSLGGDAEIGAYRRSTGESLPRIVLVIDEFHVLFDRDDRLSATASELLDRIVRQGRAFGVHTILASQTIAGVAALGRHTLNQVPIRIALQSSDADSRLLLADDNGDAALLTRPGEGILNTKGGAKDANQRFQAAYLEPERREDLLRRLRQRADAAGMVQRPVVFEGNAPARLDDIPPVALVEMAGAATPVIPLGLPLTLDAPIAASLRREPGGNLLVVGDDEQTASVVALGVAILATGEIDCDVINLGGAAAVEAALDAVSERAWVRRGRRRELRAWLRELAEEVEKRHVVADFSAPSRCLILTGLHRARDLEASGDDELTRDLETVLRDGPDAGIHVLASVDKVVSLERRLTAAAIREFGQRVAFRMSKEDSYRLVGSEVAGTMALAQATFQDDDRGITARFRPFTEPGADWIRAFVEGADIAGGDARV
jgi:hypothetical protein